MSSNLVINQCETSRTGIEKKEWEKTEDAFVIRSCRHKKNTENGLAVAAIDKYNTT